jgi:Lar family restriction alleviation protein
MTTTDDDLKACPFCGGVAHTILKPPDGVEIRCTECSARTVSVDSRDAAAADWNRRPTIPVILAAK